MDWYGAVDELPELLYEDGYHARPEGYALRGRLLAEAVPACTAEAGAGVEAPT